VSATTGALTVTNSGVTSVSGAGTVSVSASTGGVTITGTGGSGTVTSVATGNGLSGGTITSSGTLVIAAPSADSIGAYALGSYGCALTQYGNIFANANCFIVYNTQNTSAGTRSGSWRLMGRAPELDAFLAVRVS
jgi:hypothetical protein